MEWLCTKQAEQLAQQLKSAHAAGLSLPDVLTLASLMSELNAEAAEVTSATTVAELKALTGLSYDQVSRSMARIKSKGLIAREQTIKRAGHPALTTLLPNAFVAVAIPAPGTCEPVQVGVEPLPDRLRTLLCGQPWDVVVGVRDAWATHQRLPGSLASQIRGLSASQIERILAERAADACASMEAAVDQALSREEARAAGLAVVRTADGDVSVDAKAFVESLPVSGVAWEWVQDVLDELAFRDIRLVTKANVATRMAEAAYARVGLPFVMGKPWKVGVRLLARQMDVSWSKPRRIRDDWYTAAEAAVIHKPSQICRT